MTAVLHPQRARRRGATGWHGAALAGVAFLVTMLGTTLPTPLYTTYAREFHFTELMTTVIYAVYAVGVIAGLLLFGHWSDELGRRPMLMAGLVLSALSAVAFLLPAALAWLFVGRVLSGLSAGIFTGTATAAIVDLAPETRRAQASLLAAAVNMGGLGLGPVLAGVLAQYAPLPTRLVFAVDLALIAVGLGCVMLLREPVRRAAHPSLAPRRLTVPAEVRAVFVRAAIAGFAGFAMMGLFTSVAPAFLTDVLGEGNRAVIGAVAFSVFAASVLGQATSNRLGVRRSLWFGCVALIAGMVVVSTSLVIKSLPLLLVAAIVVGVGQGMSFRAGLASVSEAVSGEHRGAVTSTLFVTLYIGISIPVIGVGAMAVSVGLITAGLVFAGLVAALTAAVLVLLARGR